MDQKKIYHFVSKGGLLRTQFPKYCTFGGYTVYRIFSLSWLHQELVVLCRLISLIFYFLEINSTERGEHKPESKIWNFLFFIQFESIIFFISPGQRPDELLPSLVPSPLNPQNQFKPNLSGMVFWWSQFKIVSDSPALNSRWLLFN